MPWVLIETGDDDRSLYLTSAPGCFANPPRVFTEESSSSIAVHAIEYLPKGHPDRITTSCIWPFVAELHSPIDGRTIQQPRWIVTPRRRLFVRHTIGLPRVLGLPPAEGRYVLWLQGYNSQVSGSGPEIVEQVPGWGLQLPNGKKPYPDPRTVMLTAGHLITIPSLPSIAVGVPTGILRAALIFGGGPALPGPPKPIAGTINMFNGQGRLIAQLATRADRYLQLALPVGSYRLVAQETWIECYSPIVRITPNHTTAATATIGCDVS